MVQRPKLIYAIAVWILFQQPFAITFPLKVLLQAIGLAPAWPRPVSGLILIAEVIILVALIQLRKPARFAAIALVSVATLVCAKIFLYQLLTGESPVTGQPYPLRSYISLALFTTGNLAVIVYLSGKKFGELSRQFREQAARRREARDLEKANSELARNLPKL